MLLALLLIGCAADPDSGEADVSGERTRDVLDAAAAQRVGGTPAHGASYLHDGGERVVGESVPHSGDGVGRDLATVDLDRDGRVELAVGGSEQIWLFPCDDDGPVAGAETNYVPSGYAPPGYYGHALAAAGDLDGDGYDDLVAGASRETSLSGGDGAAYVDYGSPTGVDTSREEQLVSPDAVGGSEFGSALASGDVNGDGYSDLAIGAWSHAHLASTGAVYLFLGGAAGIEPVAATELLPLGGEDSYLGTSVAMGDVDGDGLDDVVAGGPELRPGAVYLYPGDASGADPTAEVRVQASDGLSGDDLGRAVGVGDLDDDGYRDVAVGAPNAVTDRSSAGAVYLYPGSSAGIVTSAEEKLVSSAAEDRGSFGAPLVANVDLDLDGRDDVVVLGPTTGDHGVVSVWFGSTGTLAADEVLLTIPAEADIRALHSLAVGDVDADGLPDVLLGAPYDASISGALVGAVYWWPGDPDADADGYVASEDCDDTDATISPVGTETCNGADDDCDGDVDESGTLYGPDLDGDGYGDAASAVDTCTPPAGYVADATDCDDTSAAAHPGAAETDCADPVDHDCDGLAAADDADGDGVPTCEDCAPHDAAISPLAAEVCDGAGVDEDCDGLVDDADPDVTLRRSWSGSPTPIKTDGARRARPRRGRATALRGSPRRTAIATTGTGRSTPAPVRSAMPWVSTRTATG